MITVIPDIHADLQRLEATLAATDGPLAFLGDFIEGGQGACDRTVLTLPLWLDPDGLRLAHACWSIPDIATVAARRPDESICKFCSSNF